MSSVPSTQADRDGGPVRGRCPRSAQRRSRRRPTALVVDRRRAARPSPTSPATAGERHERLGPAVDVEQQPVGAAGRPVRPAVRRAGQVHPRRGVPDRGADAVAQRAAAPPPGVTARPPPRPARPPPRRRTGPRGRRTAPATAPVDLARYAQSVASGVDGRIEPQRTNAQSNSKRTQRRSRTDRAMAQTDRRAVLSCVGGAGRCCCAAAPAPGRPPWRRCARRADGGRPDRTARGGRRPASPGRWPLLAHASSAAARAWLLAAPGRWSVAAARRASGARSLPSRVAPRALELGRSASTVDRQRAWPVARRGASTGAGRRRPSAPASRRRPRRRSSARRSGATAGRAAPTPVAGLRARRRRRRRGRRHACGRSPRRTCAAPGPPPRPTGRSRRVAAVVGGQPRGRRRRPRPDPPGNACCARRRP